MSYRKIFPDDATRIRAERMALRLHKDGLSVRQVADQVRDEFGCGWTRSGLKDALPELLRPIPKPKARRWRDPVRLNEDAIVVADVHGTRMDSEWVEKCFNLARAWGITTLVIGGDLYDFEALTHYEHEPDETLLKEESHVDAFMDHCITRFEKVYVFPGNHERRYAKKLAYAKTTESVLEEKVGGKAKVSPYWFCLIYNEWIVGHPDRTGGRITVAKIAQKMGKNVAIGHRHQFSMEALPDGKTLAVQFGCAADPARFKYHETILSPFPAFVQGAMIIKEGTDGRIYPYPLCPLTTDFAALGRMYEGR